MGFFDKFKKGTKEWEERQVAKETGIGHDTAIGQAYIDEKRRLAIVGARQRARDEYKRKASQGSGWGSAFSSTMGSIQKGVSSYQKHSNEFAKTFPGLTSSYFGSSYFGSSPKRHKHARHKHAKASKSGKTITIRL